MPPKSKNAQSKNKRNTSKEDKTSAKKAKIDAPSEKNIEEIEKLKKNEECSKQDESDPVTDNTDKTENDINGIKDSEANNSLADSSKNTEEEEEEEEKSTKDENSGTLLICGGTNWDLIGRKELPKSVKNPLQGKNLWGPHVWRKDIRIKEVISSCTACHSVLITESGQAMAFGRNDKGQLGLGDCNSRYEPTLVESLKNIKIISAATGKGHTLFLTEDGLVYAAGDNKLGQLGLGTQGSNVTIPQLIKYNGKPIVKIKCGAEFSMILDSCGGLYSFGSPENGQLGHNSEEKYFVTSNKIAFNCELTPRKIVVFIEKTREGHTIPLDNVSIVDVACGNNHALAVDSKKRVFTWGFGGYGRLGHNETKNELMPRNLKLFDFSNRGVSQVWAGGCFSMALDINGVLYFWGQAKVTGEATMYPKPIQDLCNWKIRSVGAANKSIVVCADDSVISWGPSPTYGELGYGENKPKSSTVPQEVKILDKIYVKRVTCGYAHTLMIADDKCDLTRLPKWP